MIQSHIESWQRRAPERTSVFSRASASAMDHSTRPTAWQASSRTCALCAIDMSGTTGSSLSTISSAARNKKHSTLTPALQMLSLPCIWTCQNQQSSLGNG